MGKNLNSHVVCIADMNRSLSQYKRHGGALCLSHSEVKKIFEKFVSDEEECEALNIMNIQNTDCDMAEWAGSVSKERKLGFSLVSEGDVPGPLDQFV